MAVKGGRLVLWLQWLGGADLVGCGDDSATGPADALYRSLRDSIMAEFERNELVAVFSDSLFRTVYDSVYNAEVVRIQSQYDLLTKAPHDSLLLVQDRIYEARDSLQALASAAAVDSIYHALYGQIYDEVFSNAAAKNITFTSISRISSVSPASYPYLAKTYGANNSAGQLLALTIGNASSQTYCKIVVEAQIPGFTELATSTQVVNDGAVLFASVLERTGIEAEIVFIPGHAFIGYRTWSNSDTWEFVEATLA